MTKKYERLALFIGSVGFLGGSIWHFFIRYDGGALGDAILFGSALGSAGAIGSLLVGWTVAGFKSARK